jgi:hypothetical protein
MVLIISIAFVFLAVHVMIFVLSIATESIFLAMVKYYYVEGEYKDWIYIITSLVMNNCHFKF